MLPDWRLRRDDSRGWRRDPARPAILSVSGAVISGPDGPGLILQTPVPGISSGRNAETEMEEG